MRKRVILTSKQKVDIIESYDSQLTPMIELANKYGVSRQAIYKIIKRSGCDTTKHHYPVSCTACGTIIMRTKAVLRIRLHHFCNQECYTAFLQAGNGFPYIENRYGSMVAREKVSKYFQLQEGHIVHHEDRNQLNNDIYNLRVFACAGDHLRYHRGFDVQPIWSGKILV